MPLTFAFAFIRDEKAATSIEYALVATIVSIGILGVVTQVASTVESVFFQSIAQGFAQAQK
jgi:Flp pilus assembly pilin Flp